LALASDAFSFFRRKIVMATLRPFYAVRPPAARVAEIACAPYDVITVEEARALAAGNPLSLLHVTRPEIDLAPGVDPHADVVYETARTNLERLERAAPFAADPEPGLFAYRQVMGDHAQTGVLGCCAVDEYDADIIRKHERTRKDKEDDRTRHVVTLRMQTEPVFLAYRGADEINRLTAAACEREPVYDFVAPDGVRHTLWRIPDAAATAEAFTRVPLLYVADGHHRSASASRARAALRADNPHHTGEEAYNFFLAVAFPADQLRILPYNRVVKDLNGHTPEQFRAALAERFIVTEDAAPAPTEKGAMAMYLDGKWIGLRVRPESLAAADVIGALDVTVLQERVLSPLLGVADVRTDTRIDFIGGIRGPQELVKLVDSGAAKVAFSLYPTALDDVMAVADANEIMPPKSTWFEPKLRSGLAMHRI
jgi:uncharacterized protein (DUF1015 family)